MGGMTFNLPVVSVSPTCWFSAARKVVGVLGLPGLFGGREETEDFVGSGTEFRYSSRATTSTSSRVACASIPFDCVTSTVPAFSRLYVAVCAGWGDISLSLDFVLLITASNLFFLEFSLLRLALLASLDRFPLLLCLCFAAQSSHRYHGRNKGQLEII